MTSRLAHNLAVEGGLMASSSSKLDARSCIDSGRPRSALPLSVGLRQVSTSKAFVPPTTSCTRKTSSGRRFQVVAQTVATPPATTALARAKQIGIENTILLQGFRWFNFDIAGNPDQQWKGRWYNYIKSRLPDFQTAGFTHLWLPPPSQSPGLQGYMPGKWYDLDDSWYGSQDDLYKLNQALTGTGIVPVCDIVINHRTGSAQDGQGKWDIFYPGRRGIQNERPDGGYEIIAAGDQPYGGGGSRDTGDDFWGAPDLDHNNPKVQQDIKDWLNWLINTMGYGGFRFDMVKGYAGKFLQEYVAATTGYGVFNVCEFWDGDRQKVVNYIDSESGIATAFDFPMKFILQDAIRNRNYSSLVVNGKPAGALGFWPQRSTTFVDNHDTARDSNQFPPDHVITGYAYIFSHPGIPSVFWPHYFDWGLGAAINVLIQMRLRNNITANSKVTVLAAENDFYVAAIDSSVIVKMGPRWSMGSLLPDPKQGWRLAASGTDYAIWDKTAPLVQPTVTGVNSIPLL